MFILGVLDTVYFLLALGDQYTLVQTNRPAIGALPTTVTFTSSGALGPNGPAGVNATDSAGATTTNFALGGRATLVNVVSYYISSAGGDGFPSLRRSIHDGTPDTGMDLSILDNAEDMQFQFTLQVRGTQAAVLACQNDIGGGGAVFYNIDMTPAVQATCGGFVRGIDMTLLAFAAYPDPSFINPSYGPYGNRVTVYGLPVDNLRRSMVSVRTKIRNMGVGAEYF